jgi:hypothetical protein
MKDNNPTQPQQVDAAGQHHRDALADGAACLEAALAYRARGWSALAVCPTNHSAVGKTHARECKNPGKAPWGTWKQFQDRLPTEAELRQKWHDNPQLNVGMALGGVTRLVGLDVDEAGGEDLLVRLSGGDLPATLEFTSGKGRRLLYSVPSGVESRPTPQPGGEKVESGELRLLGHGSQTVMPPSRHRDSGRRYAWVPGRGPGEIEPAPAPAWVVALMRPDARRQGGPAPRQAAPLAVGEKIREKHRNSTLTSLGGTMRCRGMCEESIRLALLAENSKRCTPPLDEGEVEKIASSVAGYPPGEGAAPGSRRSPYFCNSGGTFRRKDTADGFVNVPLANFSAEIVEEVRIDDGGGDAQHFFHIAGQLGGVALPPANVRSAEFASMNWVIDHWGVGAIVAPGQGCKDHLRAAVQELSGNVVRRTVYAHTGWREVDGNWCYLHTGGAVGAPTGVEVELDGRLANYRLPEPPQGELLREAVRADVRLLRAASPRLTYPLHGGVFRAVLGPADCSVNIVGRTGLGKSELAALFQQHFGPDMHRLNLPGNWSSTANALEALAFLAKDALLVLDDFKPQGGKSEQDQWHAKADRVLRAQGNNSARQRCWADGTLRDDRPPRGLIVVTGEDVPRGESLLARSLTLHVRKGDIELPSLTPFQQDAAGGRYTQTLSGFAAWLAPQYAAVRARLRAEHAALRDKALAGNVHPRTPGITADLALGLNYFLEFALAVGAIDAARRDELAAEGWAAITEAGAEQEAEILAQNPVRRFLQLLRAVLNSGRGHLADKRGDAPDQAGAWGWRREEYGTGENLTRVWKPQGKRIGWVDEGDAFLDPETSYAEAQRLGDEQGERLPLSQRQLQRQMKGLGLLASYEPEKTTNRRTVQGHEHTILHLSTASLFPPGQKNPGPPMPEKPGEPGEPGEPGATPGKHWGNSPCSSPGSSFEPGDEQEKPGERFSPSGGHSPGSDGQSPGSKYEPGGKNTRRTQGKEGIPPVPPVPPVPGGEGTGFLEDSVIV